MRDDNLKDRGKLKWTPFLMPEHADFLKEIEHNHNKIKRPSLDMAQLDDMERIMSKAMEFNVSVQFSVFEPVPFLNGQETGNILLILGKIHYINQHRRMFHVIDSKGDTRFIKFEDVVSVEIK